MRCNREYIGTHFTHQPTAPFHPEHSPRLLVALIDGGMEVRWEKKGSGRR
jgi:hypothetical protein